MSYKDSKKTLMHYIMGVNAVSLILKEENKRIQKVYILKSKNIQSRKKDLIHKLSDKKILISYKSSKQLEAIVNSQSHQGVIALVRQKKRETLESFLKKRKDKKSLVLVLDSITDSQNIGAILRIADCFSVDSVIVNKKTDISPTISKVSSGASEFVKIIGASAFDAIESLKKDGYFILATAIEASSTTFHKKIFSHKKLAIIVGSEGKGLSKGILKKCHKICYIPMRGKVDSLNVAQTVAVLLSQYYL